MVTCIIANDGTKLMPTTDIKRVRKFLKQNRAKIICYYPFTIQLLYQTAETNTQPIEMGVDAGYQVVGISIKSEKHEFVSAEHELLQNEVEHHHDQRMYRRTRRNRLRYRKPRFNNRRIPEGWLAPSIKNKKDQHIMLVNRYFKALPITTIVVETAQFDTQLVEAIEKGEAIPTGKDYQQGERYAYDTLREAVFARDNYTCQVCGKSAIKDKVILEIHHLGYRQNDRSNRLNNLISVCTKCHTSKNHKAGGKLYKLIPKLHHYKGMAFMNSVRWQIYNQLKGMYPNLEIKLTNGVLTKRTRKDRNIPKSHANDAYVMGYFYPKHRSFTIFYKKKRRNNRILSKFYDAKYIDIRNGSVKTGQQLSTNRTDRSILRNNPYNERLFRGCKVKKGYYSIRKKRYPLQPHDTVQYNNKKYKVKGIQNKGDYIALTTNEKSLVVKTTKVKPLYHIGGWIRVA